MKNLLIIITFFLAQTSYAGLLGSSLQYGEPTTGVIFKSNEGEIKIEPNPTTELAITFLGPQYSFGMQFSSEKEDDGDTFESTYSTFKISVYSGAYIVDLYYNSFSDFYVLEDIESMTSSSAKESLSSSHIGAQGLVYLTETKIHEIHGEYVVFPKTGYGLFIKGKADHQEISAEKKLIPSKYASSFSAISDIKKINVDSLEILGGFSALYAWDSIYVQSKLMFGSSFENHILDGDEKTTRSMVAPVGGALLGLAYYQSDLQAGLRARLHQKNSSFNGIEYIEYTGAAYAFLTVLY